MPNFGSRLAAAFKQRGSRSPSPNPPLALPPPSSTPVTSDFPAMRSYIIYDGPLYLGSNIRKPCIPPLPLPVYEATWLERDRWESQGLFAEDLRPSHFLNLRWANENNIPAPIVVAKLSRPSQTLGRERIPDQQGTPTESYLVWHPEQVLPKGGIVSANELERDAIVGVVRQLKEILKVFHAREDTRGEGLRGMVGTEGGDDIMRLGPYDRRDKIEFMETMTQEEYWVTWKCAQREAYEEDATRTVLTTPIDNTVPENIENHLRRICEKDWKLRFTHGCLVADKIFCTRNGTIVSLGEWANAGWWPEWYEAARAMRTMQFDRAGKPWVATLEASDIFADTADYWDSTKTVEIYFDGPKGSTEATMEASKRPTRTQSARLLKYL